MPPAHPTHLSESTDKPFALGLDFGTTNTVLAAADEMGRARVIPFTLRTERDEEHHTTFRSALCFWEEEVERGLDLKFDAGPWAIERFIDDPFGCRFLQSFKTFAASKSFTETYIHGRKYSFENLLTAFIDRMRSHADGLPSAIPRTLVVGRPVAFAGVQADEQLALSRYQKAFAEIGFENVVYVYEPVAAAYFFAQRLTEAATVLVADFGGGTSDFSVIRFDPTGGSLTSEALSHSGVAVAGDSFDYRILQHAVLPQLGYRAAYRSINKTLEMPAHYHHRFAQWSQLALMKSPVVLRELREFQRYAVAPDGLQAFIAIIENDLGYPLYKAVSNAKTALSTATETTFTFQANTLAETLSLSARITRSEFESWIAPELAMIESAVNEALAKAKLSADQIDRVFLTGGSSYVPAVREVFERRFDAGKIETGDQLESIAYGLALIARSDQPERWSAR